MKKHLFIILAVIAFFSVFVAIKNERNLIPLVFEGSLNGCSEKIVYINEMLAKEDSVSLIECLNERNVKYILSYDTSYFDVRKKNGCLMFISSEGLLLRRYSLSIGRDDLHAIHKIFFALNFFFFKIPLGDWIPFRS